MTNRKQRGKIATLPWSVRQQLHSHLRDNKSLRATAEWLFGVADDQGVPIGAKWTTDSADNADAETARERALHNCEQALSTYRRSPEFQGWLADDKRHGIIGRVVANIDAAAAAGKDSHAALSGINRVAASVVYEQLEKMAGGEVAPEDLATLTSALNALSRTTLAAEKLEIDRRKLALLEANAAEAKAKLTAVVKKQGGLTPETLKQIEEAAGLL